MIRYNANDRRGYLPIAVILYRGVAAGYHDVDAYVVEDAHHFLCFARQSEMVGGAHGKHDEHTCYIERDTHGKRPSLMIGRP